MISPKEAISVAINYLQEIYGEMPGLLVEEIEFNDTQQVWFVTMGFWETLSPPPNASALGGFLLGTPKRVYKELKIDGNEGTVKSMKIRIFPSVPRG
jgi:hypothetical protein